MMSFGFKLGKTRLHKCQIKCHYYNFDFSFKISWKYSYRYPNKRWSQVKSNSSSQPRGNSKKTWNCFIWTRTSVSFTLNKQGWYKILMWIRSPVNYEIIYRIRGPFVLYTQDTHSPLEKEAFLIQGDRPEQGIQVHLAQVLRSHRPKQKMMMIRSRISNHHVNLTLVWLKRERERERSILSQWLTHLRLILTLLKFLYFSKNTSWHGRN